MELEDYLTKGEKVILQYRASRGGVQYCATNKRVIRHQKSMFTETFHDLQYEHITSVSLEVRSYWWLFIIGFLVVVLGLYLGKSESDTTLGFLLSLSGIATGLGGFYKESWFQFRAPGLTDQDRKLWRITQTKSEQAKDFVRTVQSLLRQRSEEVITTKDMSTSQSEITIPEAPASETVKFCTHCGKKNNLFAKFCQECGKLFQK